MNWLKKLRGVFGGKRPEEPSFIGGPKPGPVDIRRVLSSATRPGWPAMRGLKGAPVRRRKRRPVFDAEGNRIGQYQQRLNFIFASMRQGVEIAAARRADYVARNY